MCGCCRWCCWWCCWWLLLLSTSRFDSRDVDSGGGGGGGVEVFAVFPGVVLLLEPSCDVIDDFLGGSGFLSALLYISIIII